MTSQAQERPGHHWREPDRVAEYVQRMDRQEAERAAVFDLMCHLFPYSAGQAFRVLDVGSGYGPVAASVLRAFPNATAVGLDLSDAMMEIGRERMAAFGERFRYVGGDFSDGVLPESALAAGPFDVVVSARAIHHLPAEGMARLYRDIHDKLNAGGCFFNVDTASPEGDFLRDVFRRVRRAEGTVPQRASGEQRHADVLPHHRDATLAKHVEWLKAAGFQSVDCFWKRLDLALVGGYKSA